MKNFKDKINKKTKIKTKINDITSEVTKKYLISRINENERLLKDDCLSFAARWCLEFDIKVCEIFLDLF